MKILILGAGKMGSFFTDLLSFDHEVAVYDIDPKRMRFLYNTQRFTTMEEIEEFRPDLVINAVSLKYTLDVFRQVIPHLPKEHCILSDISSVKTGFKEFYEESGFHYVSTHPMFGPTFANLGKLSDENAIIINEGDYMGRCFFKDLYSRLGLNIFEYTFDEHDQTVAYSLSIPFISTFAFAAVMKHQAAHEDRQGCAERGRHPAARNPVQPLHQRPGGTNPHGDERAHRHHRHERRGAHAALSDKNQKEHQIVFKQFLHYGHTG